MARIVLIGDTHVGARNGAAWLLDAQRRFFREVFFPFLNDPNEKIDSVIHLGDLVDRRKGIDYKISRFLRQEFLDPLEGVYHSREIDVTLIHGNHDQPNRGDADGNCLDELVKDRYPFRCKTTPERDWVGSHTALFLPWICDQNYKESMKEIDVGAEYVFAHLEMAGRRMYANQPLSVHGMASNIFKNCGNVFSGHFHQASSQDRIHYIGAPYEMTWADAGCERGFRVLDTDTGEYEFVSNPFTVFEEIRYDGKIRKNDIPVGLSGKIVRIHVQNRGKASDFELFIRKIEDASAEEVTVIEQPAKAETVTASQSPSATGDDMLDLIRDGIHENENFLDKPALNVLMESVYKEAMTTG